MTLKIPRNTCLNSSSRVRVGQIGGGRQTDSFYTEGSSTFFTGAPRGSVCTAFRHSYVANCGTPLYYLAERYFSFVCFALRNIGRHFGKWRTECHGGFSTCGRNVPHTESWICFCLARSSRENRPSVFFLGESEDGHALLSTTCESDVLAQKNFGLRTSPCSVRRQKSSSTTFCLSVFRRSNYLMFSCPKGYKGEDGSSNVVRRTCRKSLYGARGRSYVLYTGGEKNVCQKDVDCTSTRSW